MTITQRQYGHGSITLTAYESSRRIQVEATADNSVMDWTDLFEFVDEIRKPQQVTTVEELDALPEGSVVMGPWATYQLVLGGWVTLGGPGSVAVELPATVLHVGGAE